MMDYYLPLKHAHILIALVSGVGFALRGYLRVVLERELPYPIIRIGTHIVDTLLLISGVALWIMVGWPFFSWLGLKIGLIVAYILVAMLSFRKGHSRTGILLYWLALGIFLCIALIAVYKPV